MGLLVIRVRGHSSHRGLLVPVPLGLGLELLRGLEILLRLPPVDRLIRRHLGEVRGLPLQAHLVPWALARVGGAVLEQALNEAPFTLVDIESRQATVKVQVV